MHPCGVSIMAIAVQSPQHRVAHRPAWVRRRATEPDAALAALILLLLLGGVGVLAVTLNSSTPVSIGSWFPRGTSLRSMERTSETRSIVAGDTSATPAPGLAEPASEAAGTPASPTDGATLGVGMTVRVAHTDGLGVVLHAAPAKDARIPAGLLEGTRATVLELAGSEWARVETVNRQTGWVPTAFLATND
jgi:hypothetical protein